MPNEYLQMMEEQVAGDDARFQASTTTAITVNPDQAAKVRATASYLGVPSAAVEAAPEDAQRMAQTRKLTEDTADTPVLRQQYSDADFAKLAHDDSGPLSAIERAIKGLFTGGGGVSPMPAGQAVMRGSEFSERVREYKRRNPGLDWDTARDMMAQGTIIDNQSDLIGKPVAPKPTLGTIAAGIYASVVAGAKDADAGLGRTVADWLGMPDQAAQYARAALQARGVGERAHPMFETKGADWVYSGLESTGQIAPGLALSVLARNPSIGTAAVLSSFGVNQYGTSYNKYRDRGGQVGESTLASLLEAGIEVGTEVLPMKYLTDKFGKVGLGEMVTHFLAKDAVGEQLATHLEDAVDTAVANPNKTWSQYLAERPEAAMQTLVATLTQFGVLAGSSSAARHSFMRLQAEQEQAQTADEVAQKLQGLMQIVESSLYRPRDASGFADFVSKIQVDDHDGHVYVDAGVLTDALAQSKITLGEFAQMSPNAARTLPDASAMNGSVAIPVGDLVGKLTGTPLEQALVPHLRATEDGLSQEEAKLVTQQAQQMLDQAATRVIEQAADAAVVQMSAANVKTQLLTQLEEAKRFTKDVNEAYAALASSFYTATAARYGITPEQMYARYPLKVQGVGEGQLGQDGLHAREIQIDSKWRPIADNNGRMVGRNFTEQTNFWKWFGDSKTVNAKGQPVVVYHGTAGDFAEFNRAHAGETTGAANTNLGFFFTDRADVAGRYAGMGGAEGQNVMPAYVAMHNPLQLTAANMMGADKLLVAELRPEHDGAVIHVQGASGGQTVYMVREPTQIKSATGNDGNYDPIDPNVLHQNDGKRGSFSPSKLTITLLERADLSTFLHETGHFFLEAMADMAAQPNAPADIGTDMQTVLEWFGVRTLADWQAMSLDEQRPHHEKFAESFEQYLFEGKAPSRELSGLFSRFRSWLTNVYRSLEQFMAGYGSQLSDEVRGVFDRLVATQEQIEQAEQDFGYASMLKELEGKVDPEALARYKATAAEATETALSTLQARSLRDLKWIVNARSRELRKLSADVADKRTAVEKEVKAGVDATPEVQAQKYLDAATQASPEVKDARKDWRDRRAAAVERAREGAKAVYLAQAEQQGLTGLKKGQFLAKNKKAIEHAAEGEMLKWEQENPQPIKPPVDLDLDAVAEQFGFTSGDHMLKAIEAYGPRDIAIEGITNQRMLERYGDLITPEGRQRAANEAVHNEARARAVASELAALDAGTSAPAPTGKTITAQRKNGKVSFQQTTNMLTKAARQFGEQVVARKRVRDLRASEHAAAERRAGKKALELSAAGKTKEAIAAKRDQLLNFYAAKETNEALDEVARGLKYLKKVAASDTLDPGYAEQIAVMLERFDLSPASNKALDRRATLLEWVDQQREMGIEPSIPSELMNEALRKSYKDMSVEEFRGLIDTVKQIEHLGRLKNKLLTAKGEREFAAAVAEMTQSVIDNAGDRAADTRTPNTVLGEALVGLKKFWASHIKAATWARVMDGGKDGGPMWEYIIRAANASGNKEITMREQATHDLSALLAPVIEAGKMGGKGVYVPEVGRSFNREAQLAVALNTGNASNLQRLQGGENWTPAQVDAITAHLSAEDWRFVQKVWDYFESFRPEIGAKEKRVSGVEPKWIDPQAREIQLPNGDTVKLRGGYYPVKYDPRASERAEAHADAEGSKQQMRGAYTSATTRRSFTKDRVDEVNGRPLLYSLDGVYNGVNEVIHDLSWHEFLIDANRLIKNDKLSSAMRQKYGPDAHQQFKSWLQDTATGDQRQAAAGEAALGWVRQGVSISGLGFNIMSALIQPLGITQSIVRVGPTYIGRGIARYIASPIDSTKEVHEKSDFMRTRTLTRFRELAEVRAQVKGQGTARRAIDGSAYFLMLQAQQMVDIPTWIGAYEKAIGEGNDEQRARDLSDQAVIDAQGSGTTKDQAAIERGGPALKLFTVFYSFYNTALNLGVGQTMTHTSKAKLAADYLLLFVVPAVLGAVLKDAITPGDAGDDDPRKLARKLAGEQLSYLFGLMFGVRELGSPLASLVKGERMGNDYTGPSGLRLVGDTLKLAKQGSQGDMDDGLRKAIINVAGELLRLPSAQINRSVTGAQALHDGKTHNPAALIMGYQEPHH